ncbi:MAG: FAD-dependent oxidoreductase [Candidatus Woesearchaeota archaeon]
MKVVILGGGFCGALVAKILDKRKDAEVILIDKKDYFEFTPSIHKVIFNAGYFRKITVPFSHFLKNTRIITAKLKQVTPEFVEVVNEKITFDYLVVSTGIDYPVFLENRENVCTLKSGREAAVMGAKILDSEHILIIGGGLIGTEIAGELVTKTHGKRLVIVHPHDRLLERNPPKASGYARKLFEKHGVQIIFGEKVVGHKGNTFITDKGRKIDAEAGIWCAGIKCNPWFMQGFPDSIFTEKRALKVNQYLQLDGYSNIFVGGDINNVPEEKTAQNAERHALLIVKNIGRLKNSQPLMAHRPRSAPLVISLGDRTGILTLPNGWVINGFLPGMLKWLIEWWVLRQYK